MLDEAEHQYLIALLEKHTGNVSQAAKEANMSRQGMHNLLKKHVILLQIWRQEIRGAVTFSVGSDNLVFLKNLEMMPYRPVIHPKLICQLIGVLRRFFQRLNYLGTGSATSGACNKPPEQILQRTRTNIQHTSPQLFEEFATP